MKSRNLYWLAFIVLLAGTLTVIGCSEDEMPTSPETSDPNIFCNEGLCFSNDALKNQCIDTFNTCIANTGELNDDECVASALLICRT